MARGLNDEQPIESDTAGLEGGGEGLQGRRHPCAPTCTRSTRHGRERRHEEGELSHPEAGVKDLDQPSLWPAPPGQSLIESRETARPDRHVSCTARAPDDRMTKQPGKLLRSLPPRGKRCVGLGEIGGHGETRTKYFSCPRHARGRPPRTGVGNLTSVRDSSPGAALRPRCLRSAGPFPSGPP